MPEIPKSCRGCALYCRTGFFCSVLPTESLVALSELSRPRSLKIGETISETALEMWPIIGIADGIIGVKRFQSNGNGSIAAFFVAGDIVDLRGAPARMCSDLTALTETKVCYLSPSMFDEIMASCKDARRIAWESLQSQTFRMIEQVAELSKKRAPERLAWFICEFRRLHSTNPDTTRGPIFRLPFRQVDLADYLGIQPETISRGLRHLEQQGAIRVLKAKIIEIVDQDLLMSIAMRSQDGELASAAKHRFRVLQAS